MNCDNSEDESADSIRTETYESSSDEEDEEEENDADDRKDG
jgi:hypothetical protein